MPKSQSRRLPKRITGLILSSAAALSVTVSTPAAAQVPWIELLFRGIQVIQLSNISRQDEAQLGQQINQQLLRRGMQLYRDPEVNRYVNRVGQRLADESEYTRAPYKFQVVKDSRINAFATTGGYVYVTTGLLEAADNEAQLASVMAHEIGHIASRHLIEQMQQTAIARGLLSASGLSRSTAVNLGVELAFNRPNSRQDEFEADRIGLKIMREADYAESAMPAFMKKLLKKSSTPTFLSTHPAIRDRISNLEQLIRQSPGNGCTQRPTLVGCGLNDTAYQQQVKSQV